MPDAQPNRNPTPRSPALALSALFAFLGIALGAFGAHGLEPTLIANGHLDTWKTAVLYHLVHAVALFALAAAPHLRARWTLRLWSAGIVVFSGSLYVLSLTDIGILGAITPLGGLAFLGGWIAVVLENRPRQLP